MKQKQASASRLRYVGLLLALITGGVVASFYLVIPKALAESAPAVPAQKFNGKIAFYSDENSTAANILLMNPDGSSRTP